MPEPQHLLIPSSSSTTDPRSPVLGLAGEEDDSAQTGTALCLSGGGYRAMLFHLGALWRLNEIGGLPRLKRISSVSGGSITAGVLALSWRHLAFDANGRAPNFAEIVVTPIRKLAGKTIDVTAILTGALLPGSIADRVIDAYRRHLFGDATLQDIPDDATGPRFVFNAANVQSGVLWRFSKPYMRDYRVGEVRNPNVALAVAVAASSAFPPFLSPVELDLEPSDFTPGSGLDLQHEPFTSQVLLSDGGVYDNLGLETVWKRFDTVLVSDAGGKLEAESDPDRDWPRHVYRVLNLIDNQVRSLRKRQVIDAFVRGDRKGAYWGIRTDIAHYGLADSLAAPLAATTELANTATRLKALPSARQERLINWGYAACDAAMRKHVDSTIPPSGGFPYPTGV